MSKIHQVAALAGVSIATVSHVINNTRFVSDETRKRVQAAMEEIGYQPNALARSLRRGETKTLGVILPDSSNPYFAEIGRGLELLAFNEGYSIILCNSENDAEIEHQYAEVLSKKQVDGIFFVGTGERPETLLTLLKHNLPLVVMMRDFGDVQVDTVQSDNYQGGTLATRHLLDAGHTRIACIMGPSGLTLSSQRVNAFKDTLIAAGITPDDSMILQGDFHAESACVITRQLLKRPDPPTAIFACNDLMAIGVICAAAELGRRVPGDLAVIGFDNIQLGNFSVPRLTTVAQPKDELVQTATRYMLERIADHSLLPRKSVIPTNLVIRQSCGHPV